jgi:uncharacterized protein
MEIKQYDKPEGGKFVASENGTETGRLIYSSTADNVVIESTRVPDEFSGRGIGKELVLAVVEYARQNGFTIIPVCPYAKKVLERGGYEDVLDIQVP